MVELGELGVGEFVALLHQLGGVGGIGVVEGGDDLGVEVGVVSTEVAAQGPAGGLVRVGGALEDAFDTAGEGVAGFLLFADEGLAVGVVAGADVLREIIASGDDAGGADVEVLPLGLDVGEVMEVFLRLPQLGVQRREDTGDTLRLLVGVLELLVSGAYVVVCFGRRQNRLSPAGLPEWADDLVAVCGVQPLELGDGLLPAFSGRFEVAEVEVIQLLVRRHGLGKSPVES
ncbi:hypothetical protein ACWD1Y_20490 [Streptomyces sp. NPDC002814]